MSTKRGRERLETYFETGDRPTEEEFSELITSGINQKDDQIFVDDTDETDPKIGIGTDQPQEKLHVDGNVEVNAHLQVKGDINGNDSNWQRLNIHASKLHAKGGAYMHMNGSDLKATNWKGQTVDDNNQGGISFVASGKGILNGFNFVHYNQERDADSPLFNSGNVGNSKTWDLSMRITGEGRVGIGTDSPRAKLQVQGVSESESNYGILVVEGENGDQDANLRFGIVEGERSWIQAHGMKPLFINRAGNNTIINPLNGNVGIGIENPSSPLHIYSRDGLDTGLILAGQANINPGDVLSTDGTGKVKWVSKTAVTSGLWVDDGSGNIKNGNTGNVKVETETFLISSRSNGAHTWLPYTNGEIYLTGDKDASGNGNIHFRSHSVADSYEHHMIVEGTGNVGIGTSAPDSKLEIEGPVGSEHGQGLLKITGKGSSKDLRFGVANDGSNPPYTWIQSYGAVPLKLNPHGAGNDVIINEAIAGNVGIGTADPKAKLHVIGDVRVADREILLRGGTDTNHGLGHFGHTNPHFDGVNIDGPVLYGHSGGALGSRTVYTDRTEEKIALRWKANGNVGIGTDSPTENLHVNGSTQIEGNLYGKNSGGQFSIYAARNGGGGYMHLRSTTYNGNNEGGITFVATRGALKRNGFTFMQNNTSDPDASNWPTLMRIDANGYVGIGTSNPEYPLHVIPKRWIEKEHYAFFTKSHKDPPTNHKPYAKVDYHSDKSNVDISIYAQGRIWCSEFNTWSDARIKTIKGISNGSLDLIILNQIQITNYTLKDIAANGNKPHKKVIGQQLKEIYPQAVSLNNDVVPDVYESADHVNGWLLLKTDLKVGQKVRLILKEKQELFTVTEVEENRFKVAEEIEDDQVFVYGREVDDFHVVDYDAISMLNVSATQELSKRVESQQKEIDELKAMVKVLMAKVSQ